jgi:hypothetical protein
MNSLVLAALPWFWLPVERTPGGYKLKDANGQACFETPEMAEM